MNNTSTPAALTYLPSRTMSGNKLHRNWSEGVRSKCGVTARRLPSIAGLEHYTLCEKCYPGEAEIATIAHAIRIARPAQF